MDTRIKKIGPEQPANSVLKKLKRNWQLYVIISLPTLIILVFSYGPMYGLQIAFKNFTAVEGIWGSPWVGLEHFKSFVNSYTFGRLIQNTLGISLFTILAGFPIPILLAVALNECGGRRFKKTVQMVTYAPHFISTVVMSGIVVMFLAPRTGIINNVITQLGGSSVDFLSLPEYFKSIYVWSGVWQNMGFNSVIYLAALAGIDPSLHEAAVVDGASRLRRIWHIDLPGILPTITILLIMSMGTVMNVGYEKILLLQNGANISASDVISTYVYRVGLINAQYSFSTAVGLFNAVINCTLLVIVNWFAKRFGDTSLW